MPPKLRKHLKVYELPPHPDYADGYFLVRRQQLRETPTLTYGAGKVFLSEYDIKRKLAPGYAHKQLAGRVFSKGVEPRPMVDKYGREDLCVGLVKKGCPDQRYTTTYSHLVACALLQADRDVHGKKCVAHYVDPENHRCYEADHYPFGDQCDCRVANFFLREVGNHRGAERDRWSSKTLPTMQRGLKRPAAALAKRRVELEAVVKKKPAAYSRPGVARVAP